MGCCGSKKNKTKLQDHGIVDERTEFNFGLVNTQSNTESESKGMGILQIIEIISFAAIFILVLKCFYQHFAFLKKKMTGRQQALLREAVELGTRADTVSIPMPGPAGASPTTLPPIYLQPVANAPIRPPKGGILPGYTDYGV